jgi:glycosyltransferase involved in cell wall biosynthesis
VDPPGELEILAARTLQRTLSTPILSVAICTHNPRPEYLARTVGALRAQTFPVGCWELLVIDNQSAPPIDLDLTWHPRSRIVREEELGLTPSRLRAFRESTSPVIVLVDDDNVLFPDYLEESAKIADSWPQLAAWGGQTIAEFEEAPPEWAKPYLWLAIREFSRNRWTNVPFVADAMPFGAGICVRRSLAEAYAQMIGSDPKRKAFDRIGRRLLGCGDTDLVLTAYDLGQGTGLFVQLKLTHLIPKSRIEEDYLLRLVESTTYSVTLLKALRGYAPLQPSRSQKLLEWYQSLHLDARVRRFEQARRCGLEAALTDSKQITQ